MSVSIRISIACVLLALLAAGCAGPQWEGVPLPGGFAQTSTEELPVVLGGGKMAAKQMNDLCALADGIKYQAFLSSEKTFDSAWKFYENHKRTQYSQKFPLPGISGGMAVMQLGALDAPEPESAAVVVIMSDGKETALTLVHVDQAAMKTLAEGGAASMFGDLDWQNLFR